MFVVDSSTTALLPTGVNGGIIYDSTTNKFKIYENGAYKTLCNTTDLACGSSTTLQGAYDNSTTPATIQLTATDDNIVFQNPATGGTDISGAAVLKIDQLATGNVEGLRVESAGTGNLLTVRDTTATAQDVFKIADGGATTLKNQTDSTAALQVQNASADVLFTANTSTNKVAIGNSTGTDTATTLLVLDNATADPTSNLVEGAMYYNSSTDKFRCYQNSAWTDCISAGGTATLQSAYDAGNTITTTSARSLSFTLADTATDSNFLVNIATGSTSKFAVQNNGTDVFGVTSSAITLSAATTSSSTITGTTLNGTTGINTGSSAGTQRIDSSGNLVNIGNITGTGAVTLASGGSSALTLDSASNILQVAATDTTLRRTASGTFAVELNDTANTVLSLTNTDGTAVANLSVEGSVTANSFSGSGASLTSLNASNISSGTLSDSRLSANVALLNGTGPQTFTGNNKFTGTLLQQNASNSTTAFQVQNAAAAPALVVDTTNLQVKTESLLALTAGVLDKNVTVTTVDSTGSVGEMNSIDVGSDGFARMSYYDTTNKDLKFIQCTNADCTTKNTTTIDSTGDVGWYSNLRMGADGFARISYFDLTNADLKFVQCTNASCSTNNITTVDSGSVGYFSSLAIGSDTFARISYYGGSQDLKFVQCTNAACSTSNINTVDSTGDVGAGNSVEVASDGFARIGYYDQTNGDLKFAQCTNAACSTSNINTVDSTGTVGWNPELEIASDGFGRMAYTDASNSALKFAQCTNASCSTSTLTTVDNDGDVGAGLTGMELGSDGYARISYWHQLIGGSFYDNALKFAQCTNASCSTSNITYLDRTGAVGRYADLSIGSDGYARISYVDDKYHDLKFARLTDDSGAEAVTGSSLGTISSPYGQLNIKDINLEGQLTVDSSGRPYAPAIDITSGGNAINISGGGSYLNAYQADGGKAFEISDAKFYWTDLQGNTLLQSESDYYGLWVGDYGDKAYSNLGDSAALLVEKYGTGDGLVVTKGTGTGEEGYLARFAVDWDTDVFSLDNTGEATFQSYADSATAFQIQNAAAETFFNANSTTKEITISSGSLTVTGLSNPGVPALTSSGTGGTLAAATYEYSLSALGKGGETSAIDSNPYSVTTTGTTSKNTLTWTAVSGATGYKLYRWDSITQETFVVTLGNVTTAVDDGSNFTWDAEATPTVGNNTGSISGAVNSSNINVNYGTLTVTGMGAPTNIALSSSGSGGSLPADYYEYYVSGLNAAGESAMYESVPDSVTTTGTTSKNTLTWDAMPGATGYRVMRYDDTRGDYYVETVGNVTTIVDDGVNYDWDVLADWDWDTPPAMIIQNTDGTDLLVADTYNSEIRVTKLKAQALATSAQSNDVATGTAETLDHTYEAVPFVSTVSSVGSVTVWMKRDATVLGGEIALTVYEDNAGQPGSQVLTLYSHDAGRLTTSSLSQLVFNASSCYSCGSNTLVPGQTYWVAISKWNIIGTGDVYIESAGAGTSGSYAYSDNGSTWTTEAKTMRYVIHSQADDPLAGTTDNGIGVYGEAQYGTAVYANSLYGTGLDAQGGQLGVKVYSGGGGMDLYGGLYGINAKSAGTAGLFMGYTSDVSTLVARKYRSSNGASVQTGTTKLLDIQYHDATSMFSVTADGHVLSKNAANSTTAFRIQNSGGDTLFTGNTSTNKVTIGNSTGTDTATTLLVLDNATADPTSNLVEGAMYYNSSTDKFRCYQNSAWADCIGSGGSTTLQGAYTNGSAGNQTITLSSANDSIILSNPSSSGTDSGYVAKIENLNTGSVAGLLVESAGTGDLFRVTDTTSSSTDVFKIANVGLITMTPQASLTSGQTHITQTLTNASSTGGTINGYSQTLTVSNTSSASTSNGFNLTVTDNASSIANTNNGLKITMNGSNASQTQFGADISVTKGVGLTVISSGAGGSVNCAGSSAALPVAGCFSGSATSATNGGIGLIAGSSGGTSAIDGSFGTGLWGQNLASGTASSFYKGLAGRAQQSTAAAYTSVGVYGEASAGAGATTYAGYFKLASGSSATAGAALYGSNSSTTAGILKLQDNATDVFTIVDGGAVLAKNETNTTTAFQIQNSSGTSLFTADTTNMRITLSDGASGSGNILVLDSSTAAPTGVNGGMYYDSTNNKFKCYQNGSWVDCIGGSGGGSTRKIYIVPEYPGGVLFADGSSNTGTMTSTYDSTNRHNYYEWVNSTGALNDYDIVARSQIPSEYASGYGTFKIWVYADSTSSANNDIKVTVKDSAGTTCANAVSVLPGSATTWTEQSVTLSGCTFAANDIVTIDVQVSSKSSNKVRVGEISYQYTN